MMDYVNFLIGLVLSLIGAITLFNVFYSKKKFSEGKLKELSSGFVLTILCGLAYAIWNTILAIDFFRVEDVFLRELPGKILVLGFFITMLKNSQILHEMTEMFGFVGNSKNKRKR